MYNLALIEFNVGKEKYQYSPIKNHTINCMIKNAYEWGNQELVNMIIKYDSKAYLYLLKRLIMLKHNKQFLKYFTMFKIDWNQHIDIIQWLLFACIKSGNSIILRYFKNNYNSIDWNYNGRYIDYICKLDNIDDYPRNTVIMPFIIHMKYNSDFVNKSEYVLAIMSQYEGTYTYAGRYIYCVYRKKEYEQSKEFDKKFNNLVKSFK